MKKTIETAGWVLLIVIATWLAIAYDSQIFSAVRGLQSPALDQVMLLITSIATIYIGVPIILLILYFTNRKKILWDLATALVIGVLIALFLKMVIARPRPEDIANAGFLLSASMSSFPSDHAAIAFIVFGVIGHHAKKYRLWFYLLAFLIAVSRVYLGVHYPTDVVAGAFLGIAVCQIVLTYRLGERLKKAVRRN
jgi:undecaprenyl-diphosphatase